MRFAALLLLALFALATAACGGAEEARPTAETVAEDLPETDEGETDTEGETETDETEGETETETEGEDGGGEGDPEAGRQVFSDAGCGDCHTLEEAGTSGTIGPNLDEADLDFESAATQIREGGGGMPAYEGQLSDDQINDVTAFVVQASGGG